MSCLLFFLFIFFFFNDTATTEIYTLSLHDALPISALVEAAGALHQDQGVKLIFATAGQPAPEEPLVRRSPEIMHGLNNLVQNAVQFARREVSVTTFWDRSTVTVEVVDDGPGFPLHL